MRWGVGRVFLGEMRLSSMPVAALEAGEGN